MLKSKKPKKRGKTWWPFILILILLTGCGAPAAREEESGRLQVITTIFPQYDFVRQIAGGQADVRMLLKPGEEIHSYEPTPQDIRDIQNCDLFSGWKRS